MKVIQSSSSQIISALKCSFEEKLLSSSLRTFIMGKSLLRKIPKRNYDKEELIDKVIKNIRFSQRK